jgi:hypothetical protein
MEEFKAIEFQRTRDFSRKLNATFEFIRQNFKPLCKSILIIAGPSTLVGSAMAGSLFGEFLSFSSAMQQGGVTPENGSNYLLSVSFWLQIILMFVFLTIGFVVGLATINAYLLLYEKKKSNKIEVNEVWQQVLAMFWQYLGTSILFFIIFILAYLVLLIPIFVLGEISPFLIIIGFFIFFGGIIFLLFSSSLTYFVQTYEKKNFLDSLIRSFRLVNNGKWWSTFGLTMLLYLIASTVSSIFIMPYYIVSFINSLHSINTGTVIEPSSDWKIWTIVFFTLYYMANMLMAALPNVGIAFQYFNLVELKEAKGLMNQIENLGQSATTDKRPEEHY